MKHYNTEKAITATLNYMEWFGTNENFFVHPFYSYDFEAEKDLINICISEGCLHVEDVIQSTKSLQSETL